jgi:TatA/E family protein of Tat protein translocase
MFGIGGIEIVAILAIALLVFGPKRLPEVGRTLGKAARDFKGGLSEIEDVKSSLKVDVPDLTDPLGLKNTLKTDAAKKDPPKAG